MCMCNNNNQVFLFRVYRAKQKYDINHRCDTHGEAGIHIRPFCIHRRWVNQCMASFITESTSGDPPNSSGVSQKLTHTLARTNTHARTHIRTLTHTKANAWCTFTSFSILFLHFLRYTVCVRFTLVTIEYHNAYIAFSYFYNIQCRSVLPTVKINVCNNHHHRMLTVWNNLNKYFRELQNVH